MVVVCKQAQHCSWPKGEERRKTGPTRGKLIVGRRGCNHQVAMLVSLALIMLATLASLQRAPIGLVMVAAAAGATGPSSAAAAAIQTPGSKLAELGRARDKQRDLLAPNEQEPSGQSVRAAKLPLRWIMEPSEALGARTNSKRARKMSAFMPMRGRRRSADWPELALWSSSLGSSSGGNEIGSEAELTGGAAASQSPPAPTFASRLARALGSSLAWPARQRRRRAFTPMRGKKSLADETLGPLVILWPRLESQASSAAAADAAASELASQEELADFLAPGRGSGSSGALLANDQLTMAGQQQQQPIDRQASEAPSLVAEQTWGA